MSHDRSSTEVECQNGAQDLEANNSSRFIATFGGAVMIWAFDFKAKTSGAAAVFQGSLLLAYFVLISATIVASLRRGARFGDLPLLLIAIGLFVADGTFVGLYSDQSRYLILVNSIPPIIYATAAAGTYVTLQATVENPALFLTVIRTSCLVFLVTRLLFIELLSPGIDLSQSRYEVLSGAIVPSLGIAAVAFVRRLNKFDVTILLLQTTTLLVSVTRTVFLVVITQIAAIFLARPKIIWKPASVSAGAALAVIILLLFGIDTWAGTGLLDRWVQRITVSQRMGFDPTALTRNAETQFMVESFSASVESVLFGNGLAAETSLIGRDAITVGAAVGRGSVEFHSIGYGHENHVSIVFIAGLLGGGALLLVQWINGFQAILIIRKLSADTAAVCDDATRIGTWGAVTVIGMMTAGFLSGSLGDRPTCLWYGVGTGMLYWIRSFVKKVDRGSAP